jgi:hypothetical protein
MRTIPNQVIQAIQETGGPKIPDPATISRTKKMSDFKFSKKLRMKLAGKLNNIGARFNNQTSITARDLEACDTVQDCIDLVLKYALTIR